MRRFIYIFLLLQGIYAFAHEKTDSLSITFNQGSYVIDMSLDNNRATIDSVISKMNKHLCDSTLQLDKISIIGSSSPEGGVAVNNRVSLKRAQSVANLIKVDSITPDIEAIGRNWKGLKALAEVDARLPYRQKTLALLDNIIAQVNNGVSTEHQLTLLKRLAGGAPYRYMYKHYFPALRFSSVMLSYTIVENPLPEPQPVEPVPTPEPESGTTELQPIEPQPIPSAGSPLKFALRTNLLYDLLAVPNLALELTLGNDWSIIAGWDYAWWSNSSHHRSWRFVGGELAVRRIFGRHHVGAYAQRFVYDFAFGNRGYLGGKPSGNALQNASYSAGLEYGYSLPIARRLNLDFTLGVGYMGGKYYEYCPIDNCDVWQYTKNRRWFGPTKAEISLVWLIGKNNFNKKKGGEK